MNPQPYDERRILPHMLRTLRDDIQTVQQKGAGYYSCQPFVDKYNRLLDKTRSMFPDSSLIDTFDPVELVHSVDPADKMKVTQQVLIELGQLITLVDQLLNVKAEQGGDTTR